MATTEQRLKTVIAERFCLREAEVRPEAFFVEDLGADSLDIVELVMAMEEEFGIRIQDQDLEHIQTVTDLVHYVEAHRPSPREATADGREEKRSFA